jgi:type IV pilus biogenesis protein CpaD/CtpE
VTIKFDRPNVTYREALAQAVSTARRRKPDTAFDVVGVSPGRSVVPEATARAQEVANTLTTLGVDPTKIRLYNASNTSSQSPEVRIYAR